ncbi:MAG: universal stress protein [Chloroflexi bacterium]|nr:universal stress protein [Chloroflexota bacterium]
MFRKILVPMDGSNISEGIAGWTTSFARPIGAEMILLAVVDPGKIPMPDRPSFGTRTEESRLHPAAAATPGPQTGVLTLEPFADSGPPQLAPATGTQLVDSAVASADSYLVHQAHRLTANGLKVATRVVIGQPARQIIDQATALDADLIAMATHRESPVARGILGSVTDRVMHLSTVPVLAVHPKGHAALDLGATPPRVIFVPLDGSELSASVTPIAIDLARAFGARMEFLSVVWRYYGVGWPEKEWSPTERGAPPARDEIFRYLDKFVGDANSHGVTAHARALFGSPASRIIEESGAVEGALIVMSTRGASGFARWALGSVADKVVRSSGHPVLVVPPYTTRPDW